MRLWMGMILASLCTIGAACDPEPRCAGRLYFDPEAIVCRPCPTGATLEGGTCKCDERHTFVNNRCMLMDGAVSLEPDTGSLDDGGPASSASGCTDYCDFVEACIGDNELATAAVPDVVANLHAGDPVMCRASCEAVRDGQAVVACIEAGRQQAACAGDDDQTGLIGAFGLIESCCADRKQDPLCKSICAAVTSNALVAEMTDFCD